MSEDDTTTKVVIADDHAIVRHGLRMLLEAEDSLQVVAEAQDVEAAIRYLETRRPDVLVLDLNMPGRDSLTSIPEIRTRFPDTQIVVLTMQSDPSFAREALRAGAIGYVLKEAAGTELITAVTMAKAGRTYLQPELGARLAQTTEQDKNPGDLSEREIEVLKLIALGHTNQEIAGQLFLSVRTVESHRAHIQQKLLLSTRAELVRYAIDHQLIDL